MEKAFTTKDIKLIKERGNSIEKIQNQLAYFQKGITYINLIRSASNGDGIWVFNENEKEEITNYFDKFYDKYSVIKFVPASGAASRMFKFLSKFLQEYNPQKETINSYINYNNATELSVFLVGFKDFAFYQDLVNDTKKIHSDFDQFSKDKKDYLLIKTLLETNKWDFSNKPKAILPFHKSNLSILTPVDEQIIELDDYLNNNVTKKIHFTINQEFQKDIKEIVSKYENVEASYSYQLPSTDVLALGEMGEIYRLEDNSLFFRPGGHGALIENLNQIEADIIFIKNIDNVSIHNKTEIGNTKKLLGGILLKVQYTIFNYLKELSNNNVTEEKISEIVAFIQTKLQIELSEDFEFFQTEFKIRKLFKLLNRPIRICGMVKNEGEPGGGPFWVLNHKGHKTLQIVESSQIDLTNERQFEIFKNATHFNPVDMVCGTKDFLGKKFELNDFVDHESGFVVEKTKDANKILAYELPGLWNGAMAFWTTLFVEVPITTFNPVKTVNDLLKPSHQIDSKN